MKYTLKNEELTVTVSSVGAEIVSVLRGDCEYIWQGDPTYWRGQAPYMFPICGRLFGNKYLWRGNVYDMNCHGFLRHKEMRLIDVTDDSISFCLEANAETRAVYPFEFSVTVTHLLQGSCLFTEITVQNNGSEVMPATVGAHPGFNVPLDGKGAFTDYVLEFGEACSPDEIQMTDTCFLTGHRRAYPLVEGKRLPLSHKMFAIDAVFLSRVANRVTLRSDKSERSVTLTYPDMPYLGIWHAPRTEAPYVCIEPWCGLPSFDGETDEFATKADMFRIVPGGEKTVAMSISFD